MTTADLLIRNGVVYNGLGHEPQHVDIAVQDGCIMEMAPALPATAATIIDAQGAWVMPGIIDIHTHYDAEIEAYPGLRESVRHGVTTVLMGNCSLSLAMGDPADVVDIFARVENLPKSLLEDWLHERMQWDSPAAYYQHLETLPLGPNVAAFLGHSNLRLAVLGKQRCLDPTPVGAGAIATMAEQLDAALDAGYLGLSIDMLPWHRWLGAKYAGASIPSQYAGLREYRQLAAVLRRHGRVLQATPNANRKHSSLFLSLLSSGLGRRALKVTMLAALDFRSNRALGHLTGILTQVVNRILRGNLRFQSLASPFEIWSDGFNTPMFEEFPAGTVLMNADTHAQRQALYRDPRWRKQFRSEWLSPLNRSFHRQLDEMRIVSCPDQAVVGKTFAEVAREQSAEPLDTFLALLEEHDLALRWYAVVANDRPAVLRRILKRPFNQVGFSDAGAHNRNLAFQHAHLCLLRDAKNHADGLSVAEAIHRLTGEVAAWFGLDTGVLQPGKPADICVIDPDQLDTDLSGPQAIEDPRLNGNMRMVTDSGAIVKQVIVGGQVILDQQQFCRDYEQVRYGRLLRSQLS